MATRGGSTASRSLQDTPTWALATVCFVFVALSIFIEHLIHRLSCWLRKNRKTALFEAVEKLKSVLIVLGFMSLILTFTQYYIIKICIPIKIANTMLPCGQQLTTKTTKALGVSLEERRLAVRTTGSSYDYCDSKGMTSLISKQGLNQLSIFIFVIAVMQIVYSVLTMALGRIKMRRWKAWERETRTVEYQAANDPNRFRFTRQTTFGRRHMNSCTRTTLQLWVKCFFRQFFNSVAKVDYLTLRLGFLSAHLSPDSSFDFRKYIQRSLEDDFKTVVGISPFMWFLMVIFMLVDVHGWRVYLWVSFLPLFIVLVVGTKLEVVVAEMALQIKDQNSVIKGALLVEPNDNLFWFRHPKFVLTLLHYTLFMNAFELAFFVWVTLQFGIKSCYHEHKDIVIIRVVLAVTVQILCSYITLPLYALVTQMGSQFKSAVLEEQTANTIKAWHARAKGKRKKQGSLSSRPGHGSSSPIDSSVRSISPRETSLHSNLAPTFPLESSTGHTHEIVEHAQDEFNPPIISHSVVQIEMPHRTRIQSSLESDAVSTGNAVS
ncbi:putative MLO [Tripterygium wilfordii]|uniref:MLO-like protein n=1 Tax=Tripterygium wilfordii TaxID=458696 RepID=A0A7J7DEJ4_TRIWF|nr:MLO-like protein 3 [Tripterygium wilfordii]KAF5744688.1 putative MLO [Tripterygium wilfordii]